MRAVNKNKITIICIAIVVFIFALGIIIALIRPRPTWDMTYRITNNAGLQLYGYYDYRQTFKVTGEITVENYESGLYILTASAVDELGYTTSIFTTLNIDGDDTYSFVMDSFYHTNGGKIVEMVDIELKEV